MIIRKGTRETNDKGFVFVKCPYCSKENKLNAEQVQDTIMRLEDMFDNL